MTMHSAYEPAPLDRPAADPGLWLLDPEVVFLNHGSFGSCPRAVLEAQHEWQCRLERQPLRFFVRELEGCLDKARAAVAGFVGAATDDVSFCVNATAGVNTVLRSLRWNPGDELLVTNQEYNASRNALNYAAGLHGVQVVEAAVPFPLKSADEVVAAVLAKVTAHTRLLLVDHVVSQTGLIMPIEILVRELAARGIDTLVDGAHAPGMVPLDLRRLGAAYYTGNCHKWICAPKGAAFLHVRRDRQAGIRPLSISHGANSARRDRSRFRIEFDWTGTWDPSAWLAVQAALEFMAGRLPGGWPAVMARNRALALAARDILARALGVPTPCPAEMVGALAALPLPDSPATLRPPLFLDPLQDALLEKHHIEVPIMPWPAHPRRLLRISAQLYNSLPQYETLAEALKFRMAIHRVI